VQARRLDALLADVDRTIRPLVEGLEVRDLSGHNAGCLAYDTDKFAWFVGAERGRYRRAIERITERRRGGAVVDLGTFVPYLPVALARLGYRVRIVERFGLYAPAIQSAVHALAEQEGIETFDRDILTDDLADIGPADVVMLLAVVEHLNGSPRGLMTKVEGLLGGGFLLFEVPNIADLAKRLSLMIGRSPLPAYPLYLDSAYPFMGHNREMTVGEVRHLMAATGFTVERLDCYDYVPFDGIGPRGRLIRRLKPFMPLRDHRESIMVVARPAAR
jgi:hypothetical protein